MSAIFLSDGYMPRGHNNPPSEIEMAEEARKSLAAYLKDNPVIQSDAEAREAKLYLDRGNGSLADLDRARKAKSEPLHAAWKAAIAEFKPAEAALAIELDLLKSRLTGWALAEEARRWAEAQEMRAAAKEKERKAREAELLEAEAKDNAAQGEIGVDVGAAVQNADQKFAEYERAQREAIRAQKDSHVRIGGGFGRAVTLKTKETLILNDAMSALQAIGVTDDIEAAIIKSARAYRKLHDALPAGVIAIEDRKI